MTKQGQDNMISSIKILAMAFAGLAAIASPFISIGAAKTSLEKNASDIKKLEESQSVIWKNLSTYRDLTIRHETSIPALETRLNRMEDKIDRIYEAVRAEH